MSEDPQPSSTTPSFSTARRWKIIFDTIIRTVLVLAVVVMVNYLGAALSHQFFLSSQTRVHLSPHTTSFLQTMTNHVEVTVYYDKDDGMFSTIMAVLNEYHRIDPHINVTVVDYHRDPAQAIQIQQKYGLASEISNPNSPPQKNVVIFDNGGRFKVAPGQELVQFGATGMTKDKKIEFRPVAFYGEKMFTSMLIDITNPKPFAAYFLQGDGEPSPTDTGDNGYIKLYEIMRENYVSVTPLSLSGDGDIPSDCNLLVIASPRTMFSESELNKINHYLTQGGRLLVLMDYDFIDHPTGLEDFLAQWGVNVGMYIVQDPNTTGTGNGFELIVQNFSTHSVVNALAQSKLEMFMARPVGKTNPQNAPVGSPTVTELAYSSPDSVLYNQHGVSPRPFPLMVAVEQNSVKGLAGINGGMRMVVVGDSMFLNNQVIEGGANRDFAGYAINWLLDRPTLLNGVGPSPVTEFRLLMTQAQIRNVRWLLLGALPGVVLIFGGLVWLRRRK